MATTDHFKRKNVPNEKIEKNKEWMRSRPDIARGKPSELDWYELEVFGDYNEVVAKDLHKALKDSGFLAKHPLFRIKVEPM